MYKITLTAEASTDFSNPKELDGIDCQDCFCDYMDDSDWEKQLSGGYMRFEYILDRLFVITEYESERLLSKDESHDLIEYTQGQWSDGIGEGFEQFPCIEINGEEAYIYRLGILTKSLKLHN